MSTPMRVPSGPLAGIVFLMRNLRDFCAAVVRLTVIGRQERLPNDGANIRRIGKLAARWKSNDASGRLGMEMVVPGSMLSTMVQLDFGFCGGGAVCSMKGNHAAEEDGSYEELVSHHPWIVGCAIRHAVQRL